MPTDGILSGIRVIDCGTYIAGPASATVMSDFGADVFKIESPQGGGFFPLSPPPHWGRSGLMTSVAGRDGTPSGPRPGIGDHPTATALFGAIMLGLYNRERTGRGTKVSTSLIASGAWAHGCDLQAKMFGAEFPQP